MIFSFHNLYECQIDATNIHMCDARVCVCVYVYEIEYFIRNRLAYECVCVCGLKVDTF